MLAVVLQNQLILHPNYPKPQPDDKKEALIQVLKAGICHTDIELVRGYKQFRGVLGHEFVGVVERHPDPAWIGKRVVGEINISCGQCGYCQRNLLTHCEDRKVLGIHKHDGAIAQYLVLPTANLHLVPDSVSDEAAVFTEPLAAVLEILQQVSIRPTDRVIVLGDGKLGILCAQVLSLLPCQVSLLGHYPEKLKLAQESGVPDVHRATDFMPDRYRGVDVLIECTGRPEALAMAFDLLRPRGTLVLKSTYCEFAHLDISRAVVHEWTLIGSRCGPFAPALALLASGKIKVLPLVQARYPLTQSLDALQKAQEKGVLKVLIEMAG